VAHAIETGIGGMSLDDVAGEVAKLQILDQTLTKCGHDSLLGKRSDP
jgi:hypothetical protein